MNEPTPWSDETSDPLADFREWIKIYENETPEDVREKLKNTEMLYPSSLTLRVKKFLKDQE